MNPFSFVITIVNPVHFTISMSLVIFVGSSILITTFPSENTKTRFFIKLILTFIAITILCLGSFSPFAFSMFHSIFELSNINGSVFPFILSISMWFSIIILTCVNIPISKNIRSLAMFQTKFPLTLISISIFPLMNTIAVCFTFQPFTNV